MGRRYTYITGMRKQPRREDKLKRSTRGEKYMDASNMKERLERLSTKTTSGCIVWLGCKAGKGYGVISSRNGQVYTHRASWIIANGQIPDGLCILHTCDNPPCINPDHLWLGTFKDNSQDAVSKKRLLGNRTWGELKPCAKLTVTDVIDIRSKFSRGLTVGEIHYFYPQVTWENIKAIVIRRTWKRVPDRFDQERSATRG